MNRWNKKCRQHGYWEHKHFPTLGNSWAKYTLNNGMYLGYEKWYDANDNSKTQCKVISI